MLVLHTLFLMCLPTGVLIRQLPLSGVCVVPSAHQSGSQTAQLTGGGLVPH